MCRIIRLKGIGMHSTLLASDFQRTEPKRKAKNRKSCSVCSLMGLVMCILYFVQQPRPMQWLRPDPRASNCSPEWVTKHPDCVRLHNTWPLRGPVLISAFACLFRCIFTLIEWGSLWQHVAFLNDEEEWVALKQLSQREAYNQAII